MYVNLILKPIDYTNYGGQHYDMVLVAALHNGQTQAQHISKRPAAAASALRLTIWYSTVYKRHACSSVPDTSHPYSVCVCVLYLHDRALNVCVTFGR